jgi:hypothetical protein
LHGIHLRNPADRVKLGRDCLFYALTGPLPEVWYHLTLQAHSSEGLGQLKSRQQRMREGKPTILKDQDGGSFRLVE